MQTAESNLAIDSVKMFAALTIGGLVSIGISLMIARNLGTTGFGTYTIVMSTQTVVGLFAGMSMGMTLSKFVSEYRARESDLALTFARSGILLVSVFSAVACAVYTLLSETIGYSLYDDPSLVSLIPLSALSVASGALYATTFGIARGCHRINLAAAMSLATPSLSLITVFLLLPALGLRGVFAGFFLSQACVSLGALGWINKTGFGLFKVRSPKVKSHVARDLLSFAVPATLSGIMIYPVYWLGNTVLALTRSMQEVGVFAVAFIFFQSLILVPQAVVVVLLPRLSELSVLSSESFRNTCASSFAHLSILMFPIVFAVGLFSTFVVKLLYGTAFSSANLPVYFMAFAALFCSWSIIIETVMGSMGRLWVVLAVGGVWSLGFLAIGYFSISAWGASGLALAFLGSYALRFLTSGFLLRVKLHISMGNAGFIALISSFWLIMGYVLMLRGFGDSPLYCSLILLAGIASVTWVNRRAISSAWSQRI